MMLTNMVWTNTSVKRLAGNSDPVEVVTDKARELVFRAMEAGWTGPPFDPLALSDFQGLRVIPRADIRDARTIPSDSILCIEYNPERPRWRVRYSIAHEIAHTLFPDCAEHARYRLTAKEMVGDQWQLEALCNIAAAEFLMPVGSLRAIALDRLGIDRLLELRKQYDVSVEAVIIRAVHMSKEPCVAFSASRIERDDNIGHFRLEYTVHSSKSDIPSERGMLLPPSSVISECTAIGYTAKGTEYINNESVHIECVAIPPYPGSQHPRVAGVFTPINHRPSKPEINYLKGDATEPRGTGQRIVAQVVNDGTMNWGGRGFAQAVRRKWPTVQDSFHQWATLRPRAEWLGSMHIAEAESNILVASMIAQKGYGPSSQPRIRYAALTRCLRQLAEVAGERRASVHMPRIGCGHAGGDWSVIQDLITETISASGIHVSVYDQPNAPFVQQQEAFQF